MNDTPNDAPLFSIVMPCYNQQAWLAQAIGCVQAQTWTDWELVLVDDGSTDGTAAIARQAAGLDARIRVLQHGRNQGLSTARNTGLAAARGLYLWMPDPDDSFDATLLREAAAALAHSAAQVVLFGVREEYFDARGTVRATRLIDAVQPTRAAAPGAVELPCGALHCPTPAAWHPAVLAWEEATLLGYAWNKIYDRAWLSRCGAAFEDVRLIEDLVFNVNVLRDAERVCVLPGTPYAYAKRDGANLTAAYVPDYWPLHLRRVAQVRDLLAGWGLLNDDARARLGARLARYLLSAAERVHDPRSGLAADGRRAWAEEALAHPLSRELLPAAASRDPRLAALLPSLARGNATALLAAGRAVHGVRGISGAAYAALKR